MTKIRTAIIYYSSTGTNYRLAKMAADGAREKGGEVKLLKVPETAPMHAIESNQAWKEHLEKTDSIPDATLEDLEWADAIVFSCPTRFGNVPAQMKQFLDSTGGLWMEGKLANKVVSAMSSANNPNGGQEQTVLSLYTTMFHWGAIVVSPGYTDESVYKAGGNPYGTTVTVDQDGNMKEEVEAAVKHQAKRTVTVAEWVKNGSD
ncbi:NAD(P)H:quinone oxidoreductase [Bacillus marinisedimentorum]|uniref:NAD(P)H:quinone oxidoreductase n=1 Tax=Bacillus marinisedimentorum TaxID=1821260 RepID=UPI000872942C|nr:NAD(P)H:quinone oxidoreductase [Bacillus marinisedimentorum]